MLKRVFLYLFSRKKAASHENSLVIQGEPYRQANDLFDEGKYEKAISAYLSAQEIGASPEISVNLAYSYLALHNFKEAEFNFFEALKQSAEFAPALAGIGDLYSKCQKYEDSISYYDRALQANPNLAAAHNNKSLSLTALGRLEEAWADAEWRYALPNTKYLYPHKYEKPRWDGSPLNGKRLLIHWEQGYGDIIQYLRFIPLAKAPDNTIIFECPAELKRLSASIKEIDEVIEAKDKPVSKLKFDFYLPLQSLPHMLRMHKNEIPCEPYLFLPSTSGASPQFLERSSKFSIGIVWEASATDLNRNCDLSDLIKLIDTDTQLVSLQKSVSQRDSSLLANHKIINAGVDCSDFSDTAAVISSLDIVVSVDTSVAHLAGAMGKTIWLLLNEPAAERWMMNSNISPWYPSMQVFRKKMNEPWTPLIKKVKEQYINSFKNLDLPR